MKEESPVIIYGGSFDPPHKGHAALAAAALKQLRPRALYLVPNFRTPFKDFRPVAFADRAAMLKAALGPALAGRPGVKISSFEAGQRRVVYTWETLAHFKKLHPGAPLYFLMGSDCLEGFPRWRRWRGILSAARLLVGLRPGFSPAAGDVPYVPLKGSFPEAASSAMRSRLFLGAPVPEAGAAVLRYIKEKGLYLAGERALLRGLLSRKRLAHSLAVAKAAAELAPGLGLSQQKAALAGLLHDCARELTVPEMFALCSGKDRRLLAEKAPVLLHAEAGAALARKKFGVTDPEILEAIAQHAAGAPGMGPLSRLVYVCDLAAEGRSFPEAGLLRRLAPLDFDAAFAAANYVKLSYAFSSGGWVHPQSVELWNSLREEKKR